MAYALILLALLALLFGSSLSGASIPDMDTAGMSRPFINAYEAVRDRARAAIRNAVREKLHDAVDEAFTEEATPTPSSSD
ncbi:MAG TPA: hypothetical protein VD862_02485 [Candidatus Paceibacterota bacterium]|nr:hypothetical protein [Candidatus Paceibacterota bacterium]